MDKEKLRGFLDELGYSSALESDARVREWLKDHQKPGHFINGQFVPPVQGKYFPTVNPVKPSEVLAEVAYGTSEDVYLAVGVAKRAFAEWSGLAPHVRARFAYAMTRALAKNPRPTAVLESLDNGKTIRETRDIDIPLAIRHFNYHTGWAQIRDQEFPNFRPLGVIAQVIPWNFPLLMLAWKIAPAIAAGNTVVIKPSEFTPLTALMFAEMLEKEVKLPPGVVNIVTGDGETGKYLVNHPEVKGVKFTGSTEVGRWIRQATAGSGKHVTMELGGKSPFVVFEDADLDSAIEGVVDAIWFNQGQVCCAGSRLLIQESIFDEFIRRLKKRMSKLRGGVPLDKAMDIGAVNSLAQLQKIQRLVEVGKNEGGVMWQPESASWRRDCPKEGYYFPPTIFTNVQPAHTIAREEIFGPVLVCMSFRTPGEAIQLANNTRYGLAASVWSQDISKDMDAARRIKAGTIWINSTNLFDAASGFGGFRESGFGREGGREGMYEVMEEHFPEKKSPEAGESEPLAEKEPEAPVIDRTYRFLIAGKLARPDGGSSFQVKSPTGKLLGVVGDANRKDVRNAVEAARKAAEGWENTSAHLRSQILYFLAENLAVNQGRFAKEEARASVERLFHWAAYADKFEGTVQPVPGKYLVNAVKEPIGVMGIRAPDEYPLLGAVSTLAPAMAMGNTVVLVAGKHPLSAMDFLQVIQNSEVPAGVVNILTAAKPDAIAKILAEHEDVDAVWYFGDWEGSNDVEYCSTSNMKRTWVSNGRPFDWLGAQGRSLKFLREATQVKNIWVPYGV